MADKYPDDPLDALNFSIDDDDLVFSPKKTVDKDRAASLFGIGDEPKKAEGGAGPSGQPAPRSRGGSGDWLGLRDTSPIGFLNDDVKPSSAQVTTRPASDSPALLRAKTADDGRKVEPKVPARKKFNILDDLFGDTAFNKDKDKPKTSSFTTASDVNPLGTSIKAKEDASYLPSFSERRRIGDKKNPSTPKSADLSDWLLEPKDKPSRTNVSSKELPKTSTPLTAPNTSKRGFHKDGESGLPSWLSSGFNDTPVPHESSTNEERITSKSETGRHSTGVTTSQQPSSVQQTAVKKSQPDEGAQPLPGAAAQHSGAAQPSGFGQTLSIAGYPQPVYFNQMLPPPANVDPNVIGQLNSMHAQIGAAMTKHQENLQSYMQAIILEAQRVGLSQPLEVPEDPRTATKDGNGSTDDEVTEGKGSDNTEEEEKKHRRKSKKGSKSKKIKKQEFELQELEIQISKLELQIVQLELKMASAEEVKKLEIDSLKKSHEFEIAAWENRHERMKQNYDEIAKEYEEKIAKLKAKIEELEIQHKERLEALQSERMSDLEKLGEFHRIALEQAASITLPQTGGFGAFRLPMKILQKPSDETELSERESALIDKEKQVELLRQSLEMEKQNLDEAKEKEKIRKEEREREAKRAMMEAQLKEEMINKEYLRRKDQMESLQAQIEKMREDALKEQAQITREKLALAAEKAKMEAAMSLERNSESPQLQPLDMMKARAELEAALEAAREARETADRERRRHVELRKAVEETTWDQKDKEQQLAMRERHVANMLKEAETKKSEATAALDKVQTLKEEIESKQLEIQEHMRQIETKEKVLAAERMEIAREKVELEKKKTQLEILLPELNPSDDLVVQGVKQSTPSNKDYVDPKALIMRLKAEKDLQQYIAPTRSHSHQF